jgi:hypothetical protein
VPQPSTILRQYKFREYISIDVSNVGDKLPADPSTEDNLFQSLSLNVDRTVTLGLAVSADEGKAEYTAIPVLNSLSIEPFRRMGSAGIAPRILSLGTRWK